MDEDLIDEIVELMASYYDKGYQDGNFRHGGDFSYFEAEDKLKALIAKDVTNVK